MLTLSLSQSSTYNDSNQFAQLHRSRSPPVRARQERNEVVSEVQRYPCSARLCGACVLSCGSVLCCSVLVCCPALDAVRLKAGLCCASCGAYE